MLVLANPLQGEYRLVNFHSYKTSRRVLLAGGGLAAIAVFGSGAASAACSPNPTQARIITNCTGTTGSLLVDTLQSTVVVAQGAAIETMSGAGITTQNDGITLRIDGSVHTSDVGIRVQNGRPIFNTDPYAGASPPNGNYVYPYVYPHAHTTIIVGDAATVTGNAGIELSQASYNLRGHVTASIDNMGSITSSSGAAIRGSGSGAVYISQLLNRDGGFIGGVAAGVREVSNQGTIDGGAASALDLKRATDPIFGTSYATVSNEGAILSRGTAATIHSALDFLSIINSGAIENGPTGKAITAAGYLSLTNEAAGTITTGGSVAIAASDLQLINRGMIDGAVTATGSSRIDSSQGGIITGDVLLGAGDDVLVVSIDDQGLISTGIVGLIDGGAGRNSIEVSVRTDSTLNAGPVLPRNFQVFGAALVDGAELTLGIDYDSTVAFTVTGQGKLINDGRITTSGPAIGRGAYGIVDLTIVNRGTIEAMLSDPALAAINVDFAKQVENSGTISASGGMAIATGFDAQTIINSGTIQSTGPLTIGLIGGSARIENLAGGVISGVGVAIGYPTIDPYSYQSATVVNAGRIDGDVDFTGRDSQNVFIQRDGGVVNGDIKLGSGEDYYVVDGSSRAGAMLAGVNGTLDGGEGFDVILARVSEDADLTLGGTSVTGFEQVAIDVSEGKTVKFAGAIGGAGFGLTGRGTADLSVDLTQTNAAAIDATITRIPLPGELPAGAQDATSIISRGAITASFDEGRSYYYPAAVRLDFGDLFTNHGTITLKSTVDPAYGTAAAVSGGASVVNAGTIALDGGIAASGVRMVTNDGTISQVSDGASSFGISGFQSLVNNGLISTGDVAVLSAGFTDGVITNLGTIESWEAEAIRHSGYSSVRVVNGAGGVIKGGSSGPAITSTATISIENAGTIVGDVLIGRTDGFGYSSGTYIAAGGTIEGNLLFGSGNDILLVEGDQVGVSGIVDGGDGYDLYGRTFRANATVSIGQGLPASFEAEAIEAATADTVLTLAGIGPTSNHSVQFYGSGKLVNTIDFGANIDGGAAIVLNRSLRGDRAGALAFSNEGSGAFRINGIARDFANSGAITNMIAGNSIVELVAAGDQDFLFANSGTISDASFVFNTTSAVLISQDFSTDGEFAARLTNSGTINGGVVLGMRRSSIDFTNSGTLSTLDTNGAALHVFNQSDQNRSQVRIVNSGLIDGIGGYAIAVSNFDRSADDGVEPAIVLSNTGRIVGDVELSAYRVTIGQYGYPETIWGDISVDNGGIIEGDVTIGSGRDRFVLRANGSVNGRVDAGDGVDLLIFELTDGVAAPDFTPFVNFEEYAVTGSGMLLADMELPFETLGLAGGNFIVAEGSELRTSGSVTLRGREGNQSIVNNGAIYGAIETGAGDDSFANNGSVGGAIDLGAGNDHYIANYDENSGPVDGGLGSDTLSLRFSGTVQTPTLFNPSAYSNFETFETMAGVTAVDGTLAYQTLFISGGRLIGHTGSTIIAPHIIVASGATFGSAGTVVGDISVAGTLSPGASPGTMAVTGNVALAASSTTLFELGVSVSDQLLISGMLAIEDGAKLALTGDRPLTPGTALDLIIADGGITGAFADISQSATFGFIRQTDDRIQLLGQFAKVGLGGQTAATVDYVNAVLVAGEASPTLLGALPLLLTPSGDTNGEAFALLNAQTYASATQIGIERALDVAKAGRVNFVEPRPAQGWFGFGQALGSKRELEGDAKAGVARTNVDSYGMLSGIGYAAGPISLGGFIGFLNSDQDISQLGASTDADGVFGGVIAGYVEDAFSANVLISYDGGSAKTSRALPGQRTARSRYDLRSWIADAAVAYSLPVATNWFLSPQLGFTYVSTRRSGATERDAGPFGLSVAGKTSNASFLDGTLALQRNDGAVRPWASLGLRHQVSGRHTSAVAGFTGVTGDFVSYGVARGGTLATAGAGVAADLGSGISLFGTYQGEFSEVGNGHNVNVGLRVNF